MGLKMKRDIRWLDWIDLHNRKQCAWAATYLRECKYKFRIDHTDLDKIDIEIIDSLLCEKHQDSSTLLMRDMKKAWNQKINRDKSNSRKPYSFIMDTGIEHKLKLLAGRSAINRTLELLIEDAYKFKKNLEAQKKDYKDEIDNKINKQQFFIFICVF